MAVTILQRPTSPNVTNTNLVYTLESTNVNQPQFRYVIDIYDYPSQDYITTIKTYPNKEGKGVIDVSRELNDQLEYDLDFKITGSLQTDSSFKEYWLRMGEEYSTSFDEPATIYSATTDDLIEVFPGTVYKNEGSYNFDWDKYNPTFIGAPNSYSDGIFMTNFPYETEWNWTTVDTFMTLTTARVRGTTTWLYDYEDELVRSFTGPKIDTPAGNINNVGVGPANLTEYRANSGAPIDWTNVAYVQIRGYNTPYYNIGIKRDTNPHPLQPPTNCLEPTQFAFINEYGFFDYYSIFNPLRKVSNVKRNTYDKSFVDYSSELSDYNVSNRGTKQYYTEYSDTYEITTNYLNKDLAKWLTELFTSPNVFLATPNLRDPLLGDNFTPVVLTQESIEHNMNQYRQKLFQYTIQFKFANKQQPR